MMVVPSSFPVNSTAKPFACRCGECATVLSESTIASADVDAYGVEIR